MICGLDHSLPVPADILQTAFAALRPAGDTYSPSVVNEAVAEIISLFRRNDLPELAFHLRRLFDPVDKTDEIAQADTVGIRDDRGFAEHVAHDQVGALAPHAGQALISRALLRPRPQGRTISSICSGSAAASAGTSGNFSYKRGVI